MYQYQKILVPLDGSELGECTLAHVKAIAAGCKTQEVILLMVVAPAVYEHVGEGVSQSFFEQQREMEEKRRAGARAYLATVAGNLKKEGITARTAVVDGDAADIILDYAAKNQVDLLIMSTHGRSGPSRWAFGSVAEKVVHHATAPVLTITARACRIS